MASDTAAPAIVARGLRKDYPAGEETIQVLRGIDLSIARGEFVSVMGPSGSGKSTLLHLVGLLDEPTAGTLHLLGQATGGMGSNQRADARRRSLGFVFQSFNLMPRMTALQNVMLPLAISGQGRQERKQRATQVLQDVGLGDRLGHLPTKLSGGQKQRVAIARALALDPPVLLADEPTGNLDSKTSADIMALFVSLNRQGRTIVQVTHDPQIARYGSRIVHIRDGVIERDEPNRQRVEAALPGAGPGLPPMAPRPSRSTALSPARAEALRILLDRVPTAKVGPPTRTDRTDMMDRTERGSDPASRSPVRQRPDDAASAGGGKRGGSA